MGTECGSTWVCQMAVILVREIIKQMSGIQFEACSYEPECGVQMDTVCGLVEGDCQIYIHFRAEPRLFRRLALNMIGEEPESEEEIREYALEFFNVLCGRFISEIQREVKPAMRFRPLQFKLSYEENGQDPEATLSILRFSSEKRELAEFSWTKQPIEQMLKRSEGL